MSSQAQFFLIELFKQYQFLTYLFFYIAIVFLGNIFAFIGFLTIIKSGAGIIYILIMFLLAYLANISGDILWFSLGKALRDTRLGNFIFNRFAPQNLKAEEIIHKKGIKFFIFSKFFSTGGFFAFALGWAKKDFKKTINLSLVTSFFLVLIIYIISIGIILGLTSLSKVSNLFEKAEFLFIFGLILFILLEVLISKIIKKILNSNKVKKFLNFFNNENNS
jgi:membrane protein YqaA with SNARE-associated domain